MDTPAQRIPKRILYVEGNVDGTIGGSYFSLLFLVSALDRQRFDPLVVFAADNALRPRFHAAGVTTLIHAAPAPIILRGFPLARLVSKAMNFVRGAILEPLQLAAMLRRERISLVHLNNSIVRNHSWMIAARIARIRCITHERGINEEFKQRDRSLAERLDAIICISAAVRDNFAARGLGHLRMTTIHNGLDPAQMRVTRDAANVRNELGVPANARLVGIVGNIKPWKGQEVVIKAMGMLRDEFPDVICLLIGDTSPADINYRKEMLSLIARLGLAERVLITGYRNDVANYVNVLEIQIHASILPEPFGRVLLEGMALGKPLIASGGGAVPEIVVNGRTGLLFEPGKPDALADCLRTLLRDPARAAAMGRDGGRRLESDFSITHNVRETQALYDTLLHRSLHR